MQEQHCPISEDSLRRQQPQRTVNAVSYVYSCKRVGSWQTPSRECAVISSASKVYIRCGSVEHKRKDLGDHYVASQEPGCCAC